MPKKVVRSTTQQPKLTRGRPPVRTPRWYALLGLIHCTAYARAHTRAERQRRKAKYMLPPTARIIASETTDLSMKTITNALWVASEEHELFTRQRPGSRTTIPRPKTDPQGWLTARGWRALGVPPAEWVARFGKGWDVLDRMHRSADSAAALAILGDEFRAESARARRAYHAKQARARAARIAADAAEKLRRDATTISRWRRASRDS